MRVHSNKMDNNEPYNIKAHFLGVIFVLTNERVIAMISAILLMADLSILLNGTVYFNECPIDQRITNYFIMQGTTGSVGKLLPVLNKHADWLLLKYFAVICNLMTAGGVIAGSVIIYGMGQPNFDKEIGLYCREMLYNLGFLYVSTHWLLLGMIVIAISSSCFCWLYYKAMPTPKPSSDAQT
ncbi:hypothetical protein ILUMI_27357 [Ignelater luminosus]|uniref:Uncharacterized protein n=1 Tax=Ignelater luminosus TaxID=2038154 RepID=A0A8K0C380_IGNLU|nr:hypothetical protein ILUMI_27357 [Ignelater luminosus]